MPQSVDPDLQEADFSHKPTGLHSSRPLPHDDRRARLLLALAALGVVYGDIGTSPLYSLREAFSSGRGMEPTHTNIFGVLSLIFWSLIIVISIKYLVFILRADNKGEGGILALTSLVTPTHALRRGRWGLIAMGLLGASLLYGDGIITPAISVMSAVEGLERVAPAFSSFIIPITIVIIIALFMFQSRGTASVGRVFGPVTLLWFIAIGALGVWHIIDAPQILLAVSPHYAVAFFLDHGWAGFGVLSAVFLVMTGGEALYADMGHFGREPIIKAWVWVVLPALLLNYFGQGALIVTDPTATSNPFYRTVPEWALVPMVFLATAAAVIASQALISGAYSLTLQAVQLGYSPRVKIEHTSESQFGQIFIPAVNWALMLGCIGLVLGFKSSTNLAAAYGVAVSTTMTITTILLFFVARERWGWSLWSAGALTVLLLIIDIAFWTSNLMKVPAGGWFPIVVGVMVFTLMTTWKRGRLVLQKRMGERSIPRKEFLTNLAKHPPHRVPGTAVFMYRNTIDTPPALLHNLKHNKVLHERVVFLAVNTVEIPAVDKSERVYVKALGPNFWQVTLNYGFMEDVDIPAALYSLRHEELVFKPLETTYFLGRETLIARKHGELAFWREKLFSLMSKNARPATTYFRLPPNRVVEMGAQVEL